MEADNLVKEFARVVKKQRESKGLSQETLGEAAGIHPTHVGLVERGRRIPSIRVAASLANALGKPLWELIKDAETSSRKSLP